jgi:23S rRNA (adenine2503-C2)-methyltransferase
LETLAQFRADLQREQLYTVGCHMQAANNNLLGLDIQQLTGMLTGMGQPPFRARQIFHALYRKQVSALDQISTLPKDLRLVLAERGFGIFLPEIEKKFTSSDGTIRYLMRFSDGQQVETVWMPEGDDGESGDGTEAGDEETRSRAFRRSTICVSSQVGCAVNCQFCLTALLGLQRNLTPGEIVGQVIAVLKDRNVEIGRDRINLVFMGQGEPFHNYDNFIRAVRLLVEGVGIAESRMTVSTSGIVPRIYDLGKEPVRPKLAISLNASNDVDRERLMPITRKWNIAALREAAAQFPLRPRERITFEYVLLGGVNDSLASADEVVQIVSGLPAKVNLIAWNPGPEVPFHTPAPESVLAFQQRLISAGIPTFIRKPRGRDVYAACGQLKRTVATAY